MLFDLILRTDSQVNIAKKYGFSEAYISQTAKKIRLLKYPPKIIDNKLVCYKCEKEKRDLVIHHNNEINKPIAIICSHCNIKIGKNELEFESTDTRNDRIKKGRLESKILDLESQLNTLREMFKKGVIKVYDKKLTEKYKKCLEEL